MSITPFFADQVLAQALAGGAWLSLHYGDPGVEGLKELLGGSYGRQQLAFEEPAGGSIRSQAAADFDDLPQVTVTHAGLWDARDGGHLLWSAPLPRLKSLDWGDSFRVAPGNCEISLVEEAVSG